MSHVGPPVRITAYMQPSRVMLEVTDHPTAGPLARVADTADENGRGAPMVSAPAHGWGSSIIRDGQAPWADLRSPGC